jgi:aryl-alcohol dehydrogenase (NADP+)
VPGHEGGESETIIGEWTKARGNRDSVVIATKVSRHPRFPGLSAKNVAAAADASLRRLETDYIDLYYAHYDDPDVPVEEAACAFRALQIAGKIRQVGLSNFTPPRLREWISIAEANGWSLPAALQAHYNLLRRKSYESELAPVVAVMQISS